LTKVFGRWDNCFTCQMFEQVNIKKPHHLFSIIATIVIFFSIPLAVLVTLTTRLPVSRADTNLTAPVSVEESEFYTNEVLVRFTKSAKSKVKLGKPEDFGVETLNKINSKQGIKRIEKIAGEEKGSTTEKIFSWYKVTLEGDGELARGKLDKETGKLTQGSDSTKKLQGAIESLQKDPEVEIVEPNYLVRLLVAPNDPFYTSSGSWSQTYADLWGIKKINAETAWDQTTGSNTIIVADIDTGVDRNHEDLKNNIWVNSKEIPGNGVDDDANGYKDDYYGWDFANNDKDPMDDHGHGTHTVGTIAAEGNNSLGVVGVSWKAKIMALKFLSASGSGSTASAASALRYAADMGARVSSNSWGCSCQSSITNDAVAYEHSKGMVAVVAAGNSNSDALDFSPAASDYALTVAATDSNDKKAYFSNFGERIDVAAPGVDILSTRASVNPMCTTARTIGNYCHVSGTSMAAPHVAGLAALLLAKNPSLTNEQLRQIIRLGATDIGTAGKDISFGYGRISAAGSTSLVNSNPLAPLITSPKSRSLLTGTTVQIVGRASGTNFASYKLEFGLGRAPTNWTLLVQSTTPVTNGVLGNVEITKFSDLGNIIRLTVTDTLGKSYSYQVYDIKVDNINATISSPSPSLTLSQGSYQIFGTATVKSGLTFSKFTLQWQDIISQLPYTSSGVTLANGGSVAVVNGQLGTWDIGSINYGPFVKLLLTVEATSGQKDQFSVAYKTDKAFTQSTTLNFSPIEDASISKTAALSNYGNTNFLVTDGGPKKTFLVKFNVTGLNGRTVEGVKLRFYCTDPSSFGGRIYLTSGRADWQEETVTWSTAPATPTKLASFGQVTTGSFYEVNLFPLIRGQGVLSLAISTPYSNGVVYSSKEGLSSLAPKLIYTVR